MRGSINICCPFMKGVLIEHMKWLIEIYPFNLAFRIFDDEYKARDISVNGLFKTLASLGEREQEVLRMRFDERLTLEQCGKRLGLTKERIRQIEAKAIRKLRHPSRVREFSSVPMTALAEKQEELDRLMIEYNRLAKAFELVVGKEANRDTVETMAKAADVYNIPIDALGLSVRSYNALRRAGKDTLGDIAEMTERQLCKVRNLGAKSRKEVVDVLASYGLTLKYARSEDRVS